MISRIETRDMAIGFELPIEQLGYGEVNLRLNGIWRGLVVFVVLLEEVVL